MKKAVLLFVIVIGGNLCLIGGNYSGGDGTTPETAYQIATQADLIELSVSQDDWASYFIQVADIQFNPDETQVDWDGDGINEHPGDDAYGFIPIGNENTKFTGGFNGQGYTIDELYINRTSGNYVGLFGWVNGTNGTVLENINLTNVDIAGNQYVAGLAGICMEVTAENCSVSGDINGENDYAAGLIGFSIGGSMISDCQAGCNIAGHSMIGGILGYFKSPGIIQNSHASCDIDAGEGEAGGLIGYNLGTINNCFATGNISSPFLAGGLVGINEGEISNCFATAGVSGTIMLGGLVGSNEGGLVNKCYSTGNITGQYYLGGLIGENSFGNISNSFWDLETSGRTASSGGTGKSTIEMKSIMTYTDLETTGLSESWDFMGNPFDDSGDADTWNIFNTEVNDGYPYLSWQDNSSTPLITTADATNVEDMTAVLGGNITDNGGSPVTDRGIVFSRIDSTPAIGEPDVVQDENGSGTGAFSKTISALQPASLYYFQAYAINALGISYGGVKTFNTGNESYVWKGYEDSNWNNPSNWQQEQVPTNSNHVIIPYISDQMPAPVIGESGSADCVDLILETGGKLTIASGPNGTGSLITHGEIINNGTIEIMRYIPDNNLHFISVPVVGSTAANFLGDYLLNWSESTHQWYDIVDPADELQPLTGYAMQIASGAPKTYSFVGTPLTGQQDREVTFTEYSSDPDANEGANLVGNPFPSSIDWSMLDDIWGAAYFWNSENQNYASWNNGLSINGGSRYIPPMQGFFIVVDEPGIFSLDNQCRTHDGAIDYYKDQNEKISNSLLLEAYGSGKRDELLICFNQDASAGFDLKHDAFKLFPESNDAPELFSFSHQLKFAIDVTPQCETIQLGFRANTSGMYKISAKQIEDLQYAYIEDTRVNQCHNLLKGGYDFFWNPEIDNERRFLIHFKDLETEHEEVELSEISIYSFGKAIYINGASDGRMILTDMIGRTVFMKDFSCNGTIAIPVDVENGVYIVRVATHDTENQKVASHSVYIE